MELIERPNLDAITYLNSISIQSFRDDCINDAIKNGMPEPHMKDIKTWYSILKSFCLTNLKTKGITKRIYSYSMNTPAGLGGRLFCGNSMQGIWSIYRGLLMRGIGTDIDMKNCHPVILRYVCNLHDIHCPELEYYINNRDKCLSEFETKNEGKNAYLVATNNDKFTRRKDVSDAFKRYDKEMKRIQKELITKQEYKNLFDTIPEYRSSQNYNGCAINRILCYYENIVLQNALHIINTKGIEVAILMFDGLMVYGDYYSDRSLLDDIESYVESQLPGLGMKWDYKEHDCTLYIPDEFDSEDVNANRDTEYVEWKTRFESEWCKIKNTGLFIRRYEEFPGKTALIFQNEKTIKTAYMHECYFKPDDNGKMKRVSFINEWLCDLKMRCYDSVQCIPPPLVCPDNMYNIWIPSPYESQPITNEDPDFNLQAIETFAHHLKTLCNNNEETFVYVCNWIAHSIQKPGEKIGISLNFISEEGVGKNIFTNALVDLYGGNSKKLETANPERDIWGSFNELMADAYLVILSETDKRNAMGHDGKIKQAITDETITINPKGKSAFTLNSYHRFIQLTNNKDPVNTSKSDRRNVIIRCSDENKGNFDYFKMLTDTLKTPNAMRSIYWSFKTMDISSFRIGEIIQTEYHQEIIQHNVNPIELFINWFIQNHSGIVQLSSVELLAKFTDWKTETRFKFGENINALSLIKKLKLELKIPEECMIAVKGRLCNYRLYDTDKLSQFFGIETEE
jgi:hypothetical protein